MPQGIARLFYLMSLYSFPSDPSWIEDYRYAPYVKKIIITIELFYERPRLYRRVAPHEIDCQVSTSRDRRAGIPPPPQVPSWKAGSRPVYSHAGLLERHNISNEANDQDTHRQIFIDNTRIAQRPRIPLRQRSHAASRVEKRVRFLLETPSGTKLVEPSSKI